MRVGGVGAGGVGAGGVGAGGVGAGGVGTGGVGAGGGVILIGAGVGAGGLVGTGSATTWPRLLALDKSDLLCLEMPSNMTVASLPQLN